MARIVGAMFEFARRYCAWFAFGLSSIVAPLAQAADLPTCTQSLGKARAERIALNCMQVLGGRTHPPCNVNWDCQNLLEATDEGCQAAGAQAPEACKEGPGLLSLSERAAAQRYAATGLADQSAAAKIPERLKTLRAQLEPLAAKRASAANALKAGQAEFAKELKAARAAYDKYSADSKKPGAVGLDVTRHTLRAQFLAVSKHGQALSKDATAIATLDARLSAVSEPLHDTALMIVFAQQDLTSLALVLDSMSTQLAKAASKAQAELSSRQKALDNLKASASPDKAKLGAANRELAKVKLSSSSATEDAAQVKVLSLQIAAASKAVSALQVETEKERQALLGLAGKTVAALNARAPAFKDGQKLEQDRQQAQSRADEIERTINASLARRRVDAPKAEGCNLERVDFKNFSYSPSFGQSADRYAKGQLVGGDWDEYSRPHIEDIQFVDLDGNGKKEAVIAITGPPSAHSGNNNALHFFELDEQCRIQELLALDGPVSAGRMKGKSYFYSELELGTPEGQNGLFPVGSFNVELRYVNGELKEVSRKNAPFQ